MPRKPSPTADFFIRNKERAEAMKALDAFVRAGGEDHKLLAVLAIDNPSVLLAAIAQSTENLDRAKRAD
jgi:hypothetical protein